MSGGRRFKIEVTAVDAATPVIRKVGQSIGDVQKPVGQAEAGLRRIAESAALGNLSKELTKIGRGAQDAVGWIGELIPQFSTIAGIGSAAGVGAFVNQWTSHAADIGRTAQAIGQSTTQLQLWQSAARSAGLTSEDVNSALESLTTKMQDAVSGRDDPLNGVMISLGIRLQRTKDGAVDATAALMDLSAAFDATAKANGVQSARNLANAFGVGNLVPLLIQGQEKIRQFQEEARQSGGIINDEDTQRAIEYEQALVRVSNAASGTANRLGSILTPAITRTTNAIAAGLVNINRLLEATETLPAKHTIGSPQFRSAALAVGGVTPQTASTTSLIAQLLGGAADIGSSMGSGLGNWLMGKGPKPKWVNDAVRANAGSVGTPYSSGASSGYNGATPLDQLSSDELLAAARRRPINTPHSGAVRVDVTLRGAPPGTVLNVEQTGDVDASGRVETFMPTTGP